MAVCDARLGPVEVGGRTDSWRNVFLQSAGYLMRCQCIDRCDAAPSMELTLRRSACFMVVSQAYSWRLPLSLGRTRRAAGKRYNSPLARVAKLVNARDLKSLGGNP